jgi:hypothetical protein
MSGPQVLCMMPTYGRKKELLENSLACFVNQTYTNKRLFILDDLGTLSGTKLSELDKPYVSILSTTHRFQSISHKYEWIVRYTPNRIFVVWDDDDLYLPWHLEAITRALEIHEWCKPEYVYSTTGRRDSGVQIEASSGRFHGSIAVTRRAIDSIGGWVLTKRADFDQMMIAILRQRLGPPGNTIALPPPDEVAYPSYVYRWEDTRAGHCSILMESQENETWYDRYQPDNREPIAELRPHFDDKARAVLTKLKIDLKGL